MNQLENGIPILPYKGDDAYCGNLGYNQKKKKVKVKRAKDVELVKLSKYLQLLAINDEFQKRKFEAKGKNRGKYVSQLAKRNMKHFGFGKLKDATNIHQAYQFCVSG